MGSDWKIIKLGQIADVKGGKRLPKGELLQSGKNDHPYIRITDIENGEINARNLLFVPDSVFPIIKNYTVDGGNIIITIVGTIGLVTTIPNELSGASLTENAAKIIPKDDTIWPDYLAYFLKSNMGQNEVKKNIVGSTQPKLPFYGIQNIDVMLPPIEEQKRIAYILGTLDDKIELNQRMNETLETMARALFKAWFVDFEPVKAKMNGEPYPLPDEIMDLFPDELVESELGLTPKGWRVGRLGDICSVSIGGDWGKEFEFDGSISAKCLRGVDLENLRKTGNADPPVRYYSSSSLEKRHLSTNSVIVAASGVGPLGWSLWINKHFLQNFKDHLLYSNFTKCLETKNQIQAMYLDRILFEMKISKDIWEYSTGTALPNLDINGLLSNKRIVIPNSEVLSIYYRFIEFANSHLFSRVTLYLENLKNELLPTLIENDQPIS